MQRVAMMRTRVLKKGSEGSTHWSRESARDLEESTRRSRFLRVRSCWRRSSKFVAGGEP